MKDGAHLKIILAEELGREFFSDSEAEAPASVGDIIGAVRQHGDAAVRDLTQRFDEVTLDDLQVGPEAIQAAYDNVEPKTVEALEAAAKSLHAFAEVQMEAFQDFDVELQPGVVTGQRVVPIERVGVYVPGGGYPLVSSLLMGAAPARVAGVEEIAVSSPPTFQGGVHPAVLVAADVAGAAAEVYAIGGAQAIAALAYGTETVGAVDKIVGPGNRYVAQAKKEVFGRVGIDLIAGPTEVLIIADEHAAPDIVAADLLAQAEHDTDARPILVTPSEALARAVQQQVNRQLKELATREVARVAVEQNGVIVLTEDLDEAVAVANRRAPEHLELQTAEAETLSRRLKNYGSLFIEERAAEVLGDYSSGLNHTLPTGGAARYRGGLSVQDFLKFQTTLRVTDEGLAAIGPVAEALAQAEGLAGHRHAVEMRRRRG